MGRYLMFIAYIGTGFNGMQRQTGRPVKTVASVLEEALRRICADKFSFITTSSRTDRGVHALCNTIHADLKRREDNSDFDTDFLTTTLNRTFVEFQEDIRILKTLQVNDNFHSRYLVQRRTYVYQVSVVRHQRQQPPSNFTLSQSPFDYNRCYLIRRPVDIDRVKEAASVIQGTHDFKAFTSQSKLLNNPTSTLRNVEISVEPGSGLFSCYSPITADQSTYWNFVFRSRSFLYKQVRKMSGVMLAAGLGDMSIDDVRQLVNEPDTAVLRKTNIYNVPPYALYLTNIEYDSKDLVHTSLVDG